MALINSFDKLTNCQALELVQPCYQRKQLPNTGTANWWQDTWGGAGHPAAGAYGTTGKANGRVLTRATTGALVYPGNAAGGNTLHLLAATIAAQTSGSTAAEHFLCDRICDVTLAYNEASGTITGMDATSRLPAAAGGQLIVTAATALAASANSGTIDYVNERGEAKTTPLQTFTASLAAGKTAAGPLYVPLADGDLGVRSVTGWNLSASGGATGTFNIAIVRPLAMLTNGTLVLPQAREMIAAAPSQPRIYDDSCLNVFTLPNTGVQTISWGFIYLIEG